MRLNIFTDASVKHNHDNTFTVGCPGFTIFKGNQMILPVQSHFVMDSTNNESEIMAILDAIYYVVCNRYILQGVDAINIFSDSKISVFGLREWYTGWIKRVRKGRMYNSSGKIVANQKYFLQIIAFITVLNIPVNIYHCNGHIDIWNKSSVQKFMNTFRKENDCNRLLSQIERDFIIDGNNLVDEMTGIVDDVDFMFIDTNKRRRCLENVVDIEQMIQSINFDLYSSLIGNYKNIQIL